LPTLRNAAMNAQAHNADATLEEGEAS